jgi:hypothetical protein
MREHWKYLVACIGADGVILVLIVLAAIGYFMIAGGVS